MIAPRPPQSQVALGDDPLAEIELAEIEEHLLNDGLVHELERVVVVPVERRQAREEAHVGCHGGAVGLLDLAQAELGIVGVEHAHAARPVLEGKGLGLELDLVDPGDMRAHVQVGGLLHVRVTELEDDLRVAHREAVLIQDAPPQDEGVIVEHGSPRCPGRPLP